jgi:hypothetical protein
MPSFSRRITLRRDAMSLDAENVSSGKSVIQLMALIRNVLKKRDSLALKSTVNGKAC